MMAPLHFKQHHTPHLSAVSMLLMLSLSAGSALSQTAPTNPGTAKSIEDAKDKAYAAAIASCERLWDRDTHMTKKEWSSTCRRVQARLKQMELRQVVRPDVPDNPEPIEPAAAVHAVCERIATDLPGNQFGVATEFYTFMETRTPYDGRRLANVLRHVLGRPDLAADVEALLPPAPRAPDQAGVLPKAAWHVEAADRRATISAAAAEFGVPPNCILMQQVVSHGKHRWPLRRGEITGGLIDIRDLAQVMEHARPLPHPGHDQPQ